MSDEGGLAADWATSIMMKATLRPTGLLIQKSNNSKNIGFIELSRHSMLFNVLKLIQQINHFNSSQNIEQRYVQYFQNIEILLNCDQ